MHFAVIVLKILHEVEQEILSGILIETNTIFIKLIFFRCFHAF